MKIKKWKELLTGIALVGAITPAISLSVNKNNTTQTTTSLSVLKNISSKTTVDYSLVEKMMSNLTPKLLRSNLSENKLTPEQEQKIIELQHSYLDLFKSNNYSLEEIHSYMCENFPQYKEEYKKHQIKTMSLTHSNISYTNICGSSIDKDELRKQVGALWNERGVLIGATTVFAALAAGFYAAAIWTFGSTLPWAIACTTIGAQIGSALGCLCALIDRINEYIDGKITKDYLLSNIDGLKTAILVLGNSLSITGIFIPGGTIASKGILVSIAAIQISIDIILSKI